MGSLRTIGLGCFPKPFWKYNGNWSGCDSSLCLVGTFAGILIFSPSQDGCVPSHVSEEGLWEMQELDAVLMADCPAWPFPRHSLNLGRECVPTPTGLVQKGCSSKHQVEFACSGPLGLRKGQHYKKWLLLSLKESVLLKEVTSLEHFLAKCYLFPSKTYFIVLTRSYITISCTPGLACAGRLRGKSFCWGKLFIFQFPCSLEGVCLLCISCSPFCYFVWPILLTERRKAVKRDRSGYKWTVFLPSLPPHNDLLASPCSCFMAGKTEGEQS